MTANIGNAQLNPLGVAERRIALFDHGDTNALLFGGDTLAGGGGTTCSSASSATTGSRATARLDPTAARWAAPRRIRPTAATDGDDYVEGGGGSDLIFGDLGQDDLIGGSSEPLRSSQRSTRPDGADMIFGGAGTELAIERPRATRPRTGTRSTRTRSSATTARSTASSPAAQYLRFDYDTYSRATALKIIPRAV